jgi:hypothetical protein
VAAWRTAAGTEALSEESRARVLDAAYQQNRGAGAPSPLVPLFVPRHRWVWAGALPALGLTLALAIVSLPRSTDPRPAGTRVDAFKVSGEVVFLISNGGVEHRVSKRTTPGLAPAENPIPTRDGAFRDSLESGESLVFYRID